MKKRGFVFILILLQIGMATAQEKIWQGTKVRHGERVTLKAFLAEDNPQGYSVIICPGGSYYWLDKYYEGDSVACWMQGYFSFCAALPYRWVYRFHDPLPLGVPWKAASRHDHRCATGASMGPRARQ